MYSNWLLKKCSSVIPRLSAKGIEAEATISRLSTIMQPTLDNNIARADGQDKTPSESTAERDFCEERERKESAIIFKYTSKQKTQRL